MARPWTSPTPIEMRQAVEEALADLEVMEREIHEIQSAERSHTTGARLLRADYWGTRAATRKRLAEVEFLTQTGNWKRTLRGALHDYRQGLQGVKDHWVLGQYVVLESVLGEAPRGQTDSHERWWDEAYRAALLGLDNADPYEKMWARSSLADLWMVALAEDWRVPNREPARPEAVLNELREMVRVVDGEARCPALWPTFRQFWRWRYWWQNPKWEAAAELGFEYLWDLVKRRLLFSETQPPSGNGRERPGG